jgi:hypothetical protein
MNGGCKPASHPKARRMATQTPVSRQTATNPPNAQNRSAAVIVCKRRRTFHGVDIPIRFSWNNNQPPAINIGAKTQILAATNHNTTGSCPHTEINTGMTTRVDNSINNAAPPKRIAVAPSPSLGRGFTRHAQKRLMKKVEPRWANNRKPRSGTDSANRHWLLRLIRWLGLMSEVYLNHNAASIFASRKRTQRPSDSLRNTDKMCPARLIGEPLVNGVTVSDRWLQQ